MPIKNDREYRKAEALSVNDENKCIVEGYAARFEPYVLYEREDGPIYEQFEKGCFDECDMSDVIMQYDHQGQVLARNRNNTLTVSVDSEGLFISADLSKSETSRQLFEAIKNGLVDRMSWGFISGDYYFDEQSRTIVHTKIKKIFDVSAVSLPANENTSIWARSLVDGAIERRNQEMMRQELARKEKAAELDLQRRKLELKFSIDQYLQDRDYNTLL